MLIILVIIAIVFKDSFMIPIKYFIIIIIVDYSPFIDFNKPTEN